MSDYDRLVNFFVRVCNVLGVDYDLKDLNTTECCSVFVYFMRRIDKYLGGE